ncbi:MAG: DUF4186 family protein, partial [Oscillospiraceae bacterium]|nr:DUF4186 family protein [Oscillospiraceae bacterium]
MQTIDQALEKLNRSRFRSSFALSKADKEYAKKTGRETIRRPAEDLLRARPAPAAPPNGGQQTP